MTLHGPLGTFKALKINLVSIAHFLDLFELNKELYQDNLSRPLLGPIMVGDFWCFENVSILDLLIEILTRRVFFRMWLTLSIYSFQGHSNEYKILKTFNTCRHVIVNVKIQYYNRKTNLKLLKSKIFLISSKTEEINWIKEYTFRYVNACVKLQYEKIFLFLQKKMFMNILLKAFFKNE